jgi:Ca2+-transporting ATPase
MGLMVILIVVFLRYLENDPWQEILMSAIGLSIAAIPEGLPTVVIVALAIAIKRMTKRHVIIRNLSAVETLGSTDVICTDKTGTLTTGKMKVREVHPYKVIDFERLIEGFILCNNASLENSGSGDPTERSLLQYAADKNFSVEDLKARFPRVKEWSFDSERKKMSVAVRDLKDFRIITKGAPEELISCSHLSEEEKIMYLKKVHLLSSRGVRVLALGQKKKASLDVHSNDLISIERDLEFLGMVSISDPPKEESISSVKACKDAGIKVIMITGDHPSTALGVARDLGILNPGEAEVVLTGKDLDSLDDETLRQKVESTLIYARVSPFHKLRIVDSLQMNHHIVAMTGDGVNDAPALKKAQIGVAMGKGGTEVARQASSMILTDDNFSSIVSAVKEGRAIYGNIKRTIQYLLSTNLSEILIVLGASLLNLPLPFTPLGLLWINFVTDGPPSLALASEPVDETILLETRRPSPKTFFDNRFLWELFLIGLLMTIICLGVYYYSYQNEGEVKAKSYVFTLLVFMTLFRSFSCRSETKSFFQLKMNYYHLFSVLLPILIQYTMDHLEFYQRVFQVQELTLSDNSFLIALGLIPFILVELFKLENKRQKDKVSHQ